MQTIRLLNKSDAPDIVNLMSKRKLMVNSSSVEIVNYTDWLKTEAAFDLTRHRHYGLFNNDQLNVYLFTKKWTEMPPDMLTFTSSFFSNPNRTIIKDDFGHPRDSLDLINYVHIDHEDLGYKYSYNVSTWNGIDTAHKPYFMNPNCHISKYESTEIEVIPPGQTTKNELFQKYLMTRVWDIPLYIRRYTIK